MRKIISIIVFRLCLNISQLFRLEYWILGNITGKHKFMFFLDLGPKILVVRDGKVLSLGSACAVTCAFDENGKMLFSRPKCFDTEQGDLVFYGKQKVYDAYKMFSTER